MKKLVLAGVAVWAFACVLEAAPFVRIDFPCQNFWGQITAETPLPDGMWLGERTGFYDKKRKGYDFPVFVDLGKVKSFDVTFKFTGTGKARMAPSLTGYLTDAMTADDMTELICTEFSVDGDKSAQVGTFKSWKSMTPFISSTAKPYTRDITLTPGQKYYGIFVTGGRTIRVKAEFENPLE